MKHTAARQDRSRVTHMPGRPEAEQALLVERLSKCFGDRTAFADVSFTVHYGAVFSFLGPNGAGNTTVVCTLGTLLTPASGDAAVAGPALSPRNGLEIRRQGEQ